jgi:hypothetical protein
MSIAVTPTASITTRNASVPIPFFPLVVVTSMSYDVGGASLAIVMFAINTVELT